MAPIPNVENSPEVEGILNSYALIIDGIQKTIGDHCEVVLHDYRNKDHSVVAVAGSITGRETGSPMSLIGLNMLRQGDAAENDLNYITRLPDGRVLKSSTLLLRTSAGNVIGALCMNIDITELRNVGRLIDQLTGVSDEREAPQTTFSPDPDAVIDSALAEAEAVLGHPLTRLTTAERTEVFRLLEQSGVIQLKRSVPVIAERLGLSRATVYNYLVRIRNEDGEK
ncbi:transcriptional regulator [Leucobacter albus]|uniref:Transcriptional regulator n=1 Tax=Leucobacter albus TaxID=272210 RepID=A0ABW3TKB0_9MICO